ncbi:MAG: hypothetical protein H6Q16_969 [Bacteroidetes bacterium]|nr:hypothetical protein [Bacteroidota bacterium]
MAIVFFAIQGRSQDTVIVGSGPQVLSKLFNYTVPIYTFYNYSYSQQIYNAYEISAGLTSGSTNSIPTGVINDIAFQYICATNQTKNNITILMGNVNDTIFSGWISHPSMQQVYTGSIFLDSSLSQDNWVNVNLDSPFQWDGTSSIVICVVNNSGTALTSAAPTFSCQNTTFCKALTCGNSTPQYPYPNTPYSTTQNPTSTPITLLYRSSVRFILGETPNCPKPTNLSYSNISSNIATISWHENGTASQWVVEYRFASDTSWNNAISQTVNDTTIQLSSLSGNTSYFVRVKAVCSNNEESDWKESSFITTCGEIETLPYTENFDSYGTSLFPTCWTRQSTYTSYSDTYPYINSSYSSSSPSSLYFYCGSNNTYNLATTPAFDTSLHINTLMVSFKLKAEYPGSMIVGVISNPSDISTFDSITSITPSLNNWTEYDVNLSSYIGNGRYIAFKLQNITSTMGIYLDDINIHTIPTCSRPTNITATNITSTTADINFNTMANATNTVVYYRIQNSYWSTETVLSSPASLTNLTPNTIYEYYLVTGCENNDISTQTSIYTFRTACSSDNVPYLENFSTNVLNNPCWSLAKGALSTNTIFTSNASYWYYPNTPIPIADGEGGNIKSTIWGSDFYEWIISPSISLGQGTGITYQVECDVRLTKAYNATAEPDPSSDDKFAVVISRDNGQTWSINNAYIWTNNASSPRNYGTFGITPTHIVIPLTDSNNVAIDETIRIGLYVESTSSDEANSRDLYVDNLAVNPAPACPTVYGVNLNLTSTSSINVNFATDNIVTEESWNVAYGTADSLAAFNPDNASQINVISASDLPLSITNLTPGSTVYVAVQQTCLGAWSAIKSITLPSYAVSTPFIQIFDDSTNVNEWNFINGENNSSNWIIGNAFNYSLTQDSTVSGKSLYVSNDNGLTNNITPAGSNRTYAIAYIQFGNAPEFNLSFDWKSIGGYYGSYAGYVMVIDPNEVLPTTSISSYDFPTSSTILYNQSAWTHSTITLNGSYANKLKKLVFCFNNYSYASGVNGTGIGTIVDNVSIQNVSCGTPYNLTIDSVGSAGNDAYISWSSVNNNASYLVEYKTVSSNTWSQIISNTNSYQLTGLYPSTKYNLRVKSICSSTDSSNFTSELTFQTACSAITVPSPLVGFELVLPSTCWSMGTGLLPIDTSSAIITPNTYAWSSSSTEVTPGMGNSAYTYVSAYSTSNNWLITPIYNLGNGSTPALLEFDATLKSYSGAPDLTGIDDRFAVVVSTDNGLTWKNENAYIWSNATEATRVLNNLYPAQHIIIPLVNSAGIPYTGEVKIGFYLESSVNNASNNFHIDNLQINPLESCQKPTNTNVYTVYVDSVDISFTENNSATQWEYIITNDSTQNSSTLTPVTSSTNPIHISGLTPSTTYYFQMRSICDTNSPSSWSDRLIFSTPCNPASIPYLCTFENTTENINWRSQLSTASTSYPIKWIIDTSAGNGSLNTGVNSAYVSNDNSSYTVGSYPFYYSAFYRDIDFGQTGDNYTLQFNWKNDGYISGTDVHAGLRVYLMDLENNIPTDGLPANIEDPLGTFLGSGAIWRTAQMELNQITGIKRLCFVAYNRYFNFINHPAIDNISINVTSCLRPQNLRATNISTTSSDILFNANSDSYIVEYKKETDANYTSIEMFSNPVHLDSLLSATVYNVKLRGICGSDTSLYSETLTFTTPCSDYAITSFPWIEGFENGISCWVQQKDIQNIPWSNLNGYYYDESYYLGSYHAMPHSGAKISYFTNDYNAKTKIISPKLDISQLALPYLSYWFVMEKLNVNRDTLKVYYRSSEDSSWALLRTFYASEQPSWRSDSISLPYPSSTYQIAFEGIGSAGFGIGLDDVKVYETSPCLAPTGLSANVAHNSTTISWNAGGSEANWQIKLNSNGTPIDIQNTPTYSFNNLTAGTSYTAYIRANCGSFYSPWVGITFANAIVANIYTSSLTNNSATLTASYTQGSDAIIAKGFDWKLNAESNWNTQTATDIANPFSYSLTGLASNTMYDVRAYVMTSTDTAYSSIIQFTTLANTPPSVTTDSIANITQTSAIFYGTITQGTEQINARRFEYKLPSQTWEDANIISASGINNITASVTGLQQGTTYEVRAYVRTASTTEYGLTITFNTLTEGITPPTVVTLAANPINDRSATLHGTITAGSEAITNQGFEWKAVNGTTWTPVILAPVNDTITYQLTGIEPETNYEFKAFATTATTTEYGTTQTFLTLGINEIDGSVISVIMYPNPANNETKLIVSGVSGDTKIVLSDVQGRILNTININAINGVVEQTIDVNNLAKGVYYVRIQNSNLNRANKLIVK